MSTITRGQFEQALRLVDNTSGQEITATHLAEALHLDKSTASILLGLVRNRNIITDISLSPIKPERTSYKVVFFGDVHIPYQDQRATNALLEYIERTRPARVVIGGDLIDAEALSKFSKDPRGVRIEEECRQARAFLESLRQAAGKKASIVMLEGNHEERLVKRVYSTCPDIAGLIDGLLPRKLGCYDYGVEYVTGVIREGKYLNLTHGHLLRGSGGGNLPKALFDKFLESTICAHFHKSISRIFRSYSGAQYYAGSTGCLCKIPMDYDPTLQADHSFYEIEILTDGTFRARNTPIIDGQVY